MINNLHTTSIAYGNTIFTETCVTSDRYILCADRWFIGKKKMNTPKSNLQRFSVELFSCQKRTFTVLCTCNYCSSMDFYYVQVKCLLFNYVIINYTLNAQLMCSHTHTHTHTHTNTHTHAHTCMHTRTHTQARKHTRSSNKCFSQPQQMNNR